MSILNENFEQNIYSLIAYIKIGEQKHFEECPKDESDSHIFITALELELALSDKGSIDIDEEVAYKLSLLEDYKERIYRNIWDAEEDFYTTIEEDWFEGYEEGNFVRDESYNYQLWR